MQAVAYVNKVDVPQINKKRKDPVARVLTMLNILMLIAIIMVGTILVTNYIAYRAMEEDSSTIYAQVVEDSEDGDVDSDSLAEMITQMFEEAGYNNVEVTVEEEDGGYSVATTVSKYLQSFSSSATVTYTESDS